MRKVVEDNERVKRDYVFYLEQAEGLDEKSTDKVLAAILKFEESTGFRSFKNFNVEQAAKFKSTLSKAKGRHGKPLSHSTIDATLAMLRNFFKWLAGQSGYKSRIAYSDAGYFRSSRKAARIAHERREKEFPSMQACAHAFQTMPDETDFEKRNKALFAFFMLTGARVGAAASLRLKHVDLFHRRIKQDAREVNTKAAKSIDSTFFPVGPVYLEEFTRWYTHLVDIRFFGPTDALFPKAEIGIAGSGGFTVTGISRHPYANTTPLNQIIRQAFAAVQLPQYTPHSFRSTLAMLGQERCKTMEELKAWSMNLGHESISTTVTAYMPVSRQRRSDLLRNLG
jgi:integrase